MCKMFALVLLSFIVLLSLADSVDAIAKFKRTDEQLKTMWQDYIEKFGKDYTTEEYETRYKNFLGSVDRIERRNQLRKGRGAVYGLTKFADMSPKEFQEKRLMKKRPAANMATSCLANGVLSPQVSATGIPPSFDWRTKNVVTPVKNQADCGSCWAFSTTGNIESQWAIKGNPLTEFSEQLLVDCSTGCSMEEGQSVCNSGCDGGWQWNAYVDIMSWKGVELETKYPYTGQDGQCALNKSLAVAPIKNYTCITTPNGNPADEDQMAAILVANGPLAIAMDAGELEDYDSGIIDPWFGSWSCDPTQLDHAILIVGYGVESSEIWGNTPYWIVKNSWGSDWGENGYFRIIRGYGSCGLNAAVSSVIM